MRTIILLLSCYLVTGCATHFETRPLGEKETTIKDGMVYYESRMYKVTYEFRALRDSEERCIPIIDREEFQYFPDIEHPKVIVNYPAPFGASKFSVKLSEKGILTDFGSESTPQAPQLISALIKPLDLTGVLKAKVKSCNAGPVISAMHRCDKISDCVPEH